MSHTHCARTILFSRVNFHLQSFAASRAWLLGWIGVVMLAGGLRAQPVVDCVCLQQQPVLTTNACCGFIPNLCPVGTNCYNPAFFPPPGYTCVQSPAAGTLVCTSTIITITFIENVTLKSNTCFSFFQLAPPFKLVCPPDQNVLCNSTNWTLGPPIVTNVCCFSGPTTNLTVVTNWPTISATWTVLACGIVQSCVQNINFSDPNGLACQCLSVTCPSNIVVQTCFPTNSTAGLATTNVFFPAPIVTNNCIGIITNIMYNPPSGTPFPVGTNTVTCTVYDNLGNSATCTFDVIVLGDTTPPQISCAGNQTNQCGTAWAPIRPTAFDACCGTNVTITLLNVATNQTGPCQQIISFLWDAMDCNGNHTNCTDLVYVVDTLPPVIACTNQVAVCANASGLPGGGWTPTPPTATDNCCGTVVVSLLNAITNGNYPCNANITLTWKATDCCSNSSFCTQIVTLIDTNPPIINCNGPRTEECGTGWTFDTPTAFDACCGTNVTITVLSTVVSPSNACLRVYTRTWQAMDCCSNVATCSQTITEVDTHPPVLTCAPDKTVQCGTTWTFDPPTAVDACCGSNVTIIVLSTTTNAGTTCPVKITRTWQATDCCSNSITCSQTVTAVDTVPPVMSCGTNQTVQCGTTWNLSRPTAIDACCGTNVTISLVNLTTNGAGTCLELVTAVWKAADCCQNSSFCTNFVSIVDTTPPMIFCTNQVAVCVNATGLPGGGWTPTPPTATDNCCSTVVVSLFNAITNGNFPCNANITLTWQATDCCSNSSFCTQIVTLIDTNPPIINCNGPRTEECGTGWTFDTPTAFDACCGTNVTITVLSTVVSPSNACLRVYTRTWQAMDCCSNVATCSQTITEVDTHPPVLTCVPDKTVQCGTTWTFDPPTAVDACCGSNVTIIVLSTTTNAGTVCPLKITRTWQATDCCSNSITCSQTVTAVDTVPPVMSCGTNQTVQCGTTWNLSRPTAIDACCGTNVTISLVSVTTNGAGTCSELVTAVWQAMDCCQNSSFCTNFVSIVDTTPPVIFCTNQVAVCVNATGLPGGGWTPTPPTATDNCCSTVVVSLFNAITNGNYPCNANITLTWQATDCCSNSSFCTQIVTLIDTNPPIINCNGPRTEECGTGWTFDTPTAFDACCGTNVTITVLSTVVSPSNACLRVYTRTWQAMDCCSNVATCSQTITEVDTHPPVLTCVPDKTVQCGTTWTFDPPTAVDACCGSNVTIVVLSTITNAGTVCPVKITRTWLATDCCSNSITCSQMVTLVDTVPPVISCGTNQTVQCGTTWTLSRPTAIDACCGTNVTISLVNVTTNGGGSTGTGNCLDLVTAIWKATDCCQNSSFCTNFVSIVDTIPPVITCRSNYTLPCGTPLTPPPATDNCCSAPTVTILNAITNGTVPCNYNVTITWQAQDCCTNTATCTEVVTFIDTTPPTLTCATNKTVECGNSWTFDPPTAFDACCGTNITVIIQGTFTNVFSQCLALYTRKWVAVDCCANTSAICSQVVTVMDTTPPVLTCGTNKTVVCGSSWSFDPPTAVDACCGTNVTIFVLSTVTNALSPCPGTITRTWVAMDCCSNAVTCSQVVTLVDTTPPVFTSFGPNQNLQCGTPFNFLPPTAVDACCGTNVTISIFNLVTNTIGPCVDRITVRWQAMDCCGNADYATNFVTISDTTPPIITCRSNYVVQCGSPILPPPATDNCCPNPTVTMLSVVTNIAAPCNLTLTITWQAQDCCTNTATCTEVVRITDTTPPTLTCAANKTVQCGSVWSFDPPTAFDACCGTNVTITIVSTVQNIGTFCNNSQTRTWRATDCCSNSVTCSQTVTIIDTTPPVLTCATNFTVLANTPWNFTPPTAVDACCGTNVTITVIATTTNYNAALCRTVNKRTWKATDCCGRSATCSQTITVQYGPPPPNDLCSNAIAITVNAPYICGYNICATPSTNLFPAPCGSSLTSPDVWYKVTAICTGPMTVDTCLPCPGNPPFDTVISAYTGNCGGLLTQVSGTACNDNACGLRSSMTFNVIAGQTYLIRVAGASGAVGYFSIRAQQLTTPPPNDLCQNAFTVFKGVPACGYTICATPSTNLLQTPCGNSANTPDVWYKYTPACTEQITINTCGACTPCMICVAYPQYNTVLSVYTGNCPGPLSQVACNDDATSGPCAGSPQSQVTFTGTAGVTYYIRVSGAGPGTVGYFQLNLTVTPQPPPPNDLCPTATAITPGVYPWDNCNANTDGPQGPGPNCTTYQGIWYKYTPPCSGLVTVYNCGTPAASLQVYTGPCNALGLLGCGSPGGPALGCNQFTTAFQWNATGGTTYYIRVGSFAPGDTMGTLTLLGPNPPAPTCPPPGPCPGANVRAFRITGLPNCIKWGWSITAPCCMNLQNTNAGPVCSGNENTLAAAFVASINAAAAAAGCNGIVATAIPLSSPKQGRFTICTTCNNAFPFVLAVGAAGVLPQNMCVVPNPGGWNAIPVSWCSFNPDIEEVRLSGHDYNNNGVDDAIDIDLGTSQDINGNGIPDEVEGCLAPMLNAEPQSQIVQAGQPTSLTVSAAGTEPLIYAWTRNGVPVTDGPNVSGATTATLTIAAVTAAEAGDYSVTVNNDCGSVITSPANVSLVTPTLPVLYDMNFTEGWFRFTVETRIGFNYIVQYKDNLNDPSWSVLSTVPGSGQAEVILDSEPLPQQRFYRVVEQP